MTLKIVFLGILFFINCNLAFADDYLCKVVGKQWEWFGDHVASSVDYVIIGQPNRQYEVGTGVSVFGSPWGWRSQHTGNSEISAWGAGALRIRQSDEGDPFKVCATAGKLDPIRIIDMEF